MLRSAVLLCSILLHSAHSYDSAKTLFFDTASASSSDAQQQQQQSPAQQPSRYSKHIDAQQLGMSIARVLSLDTPQDSSVRLPAAGSMFSRSDINVLLMVDGLRVHAAGTGLAPFLETEFSCDASPHILMDLPASRAQDSLLSTTLATVGTSARPAVGKTGTLSSILCSSSFFDSSALRNTQLCSGASVLNNPKQTTNDKLQPLFMSLGLDASYDVPTRQWSLTKKEIESHASSALFALEISADAQFLQELAALAILKEHMASVRSDPPRAPQLVIVYASSLKYLSAQHGRTSDTLQAARLLFDSALEHVFADAMRGSESTDQKPLHMTLQIVTGADLNPQQLSATTSRRLASNSTTNGTTAGNMTLNEITQYQLNLWTGVFLALLVFASIYGVATMDIGRDSLLYAKFQADTTSKVD